MKALQETGLVVGVLLSAAVSAGAQPVGTLAVDERRGDESRRAVDYETAGAARQRALETNTAPALRAAAGAGNVQLPPEIQIDRHLLRAERLLADGEPVAALEAMNEVIALQEEHDLVLQDDFHFRYAEVAYAAGRTQTAIASLNAYLVAAGREGESYREALELLDSAEVRFEREEAARQRALRRARRQAEAERRRTEAERRRAARWPPGHVFRDCETCPELVVLPGSVLALGRYEMTVGEWRAFVSATGGTGKRPVAGPRQISSDGPSSCCVCKLGRRRGVCVVAEPYDGRDVSFADGGGVGARGGGVSAWVRPVG